jgi:hypothetical protein
MTRIWKRPESCAPTKDRLDDYNEAGCYLSKASFLWRLESETPSKPPFSKGGFSGIFNGRGEGPSPRATASRPQSLVRCTAAPWRRAFAQGDRRSPQQSPLAPGGRQQNREGFHKHFHYSVVWVSNRKYHLPHGGWRVVLWFRVEVLNER